MTTDDIAIIGLGCRVPGADNSAEFWQLLKNGENHVREVRDDRWEFRACYDPDPNVPGKSYVNKAGLLKGKYEDWDNHLFNVSDQEALCIDPQQRITLDCCHMAFEDAGITRRELEGSNTGVYIGTMNDDFKNRYYQDVFDIDSTSVSGVFPTMNSARVAFVYNLQGPAMTIDTACSSSMVAIHLGHQALLTGDCDMAVCGGVNCLLQPIVFVALSKARMLSPTGQCHTFSKDADGYARAEGCGIVILKRLADAVADNNKVYGVIKTAVNQDGHAATPINAPAGSQQLRLLRDMYGRYGIDKTRIQVIEAHGTGTVIGDPTEANALGQFFLEGTDNRKIIHIGSVKSNIGHLEGAAGVVGLIKLLLMLKNQTIVKSLFYAEGNGNPKIDFARYNMKVPTYNAVWLAGEDGVRSGCVNSFGFGGTNAHLTVTHIVQEKKAITDSDNYVIALSAPNDENLKETASVYLTEIETNSYTLHSLSYTSLCKRDHLTSRVAFTAASQIELSSQLRTFLNGNHQGPYGRCPAEREVVFVYCGMGTTWTGMCKELLQQPVFRKAVTEVDDLLKPLTKWSILSKLEMGQDVSDALVGPLSIFTCQVGLTSMWRHYGLVPDKLVGQSVGEIAAAYAAGCIDLPTAVNVIYHRSKALADVTGGGMMVVKNCSVTIVEQYCRASNGAIHIAVYTSPVSCTITGTTDGLTTLRNTLEKKLNNDNLVISVLDVNCAYHSPEVVRAADAMGNQIANIKTRRQKILLYSSVTGKAADNKMADTSYWKMNVSNSVLFQSSILSTKDPKLHTIFVEIGPSPVLRAHVADIFGDSNSYHVFPSITKQKEGATIIQTIGSLFSIGVDLSWNEIIPNVTDIAPIPVYPFQRKPLIYEADQRSGKPLLNRMSSESDMYQHMYITSSNGPQEELALTISESTSEFIFAHEVNGAIVVPGATYADVGFLIGTKLKRWPLHSVSLSLEFVHAVRIERGSTTNLSVSLEYTSGQPITFSVTKGQIRTCTGKIVVSEKSAMRTMNLQNLQVQLPKKISGEDSYKRLNQLGFRYGPQFTLMRDGYSDGKCCLINIELHPSIMQNLETSFIHPCILDVMLQTAGTLISDEIISKVQNTALFMIPVAIGKIRVYMEFQYNMVAYAATVSQISLPSMVKGHYNVALMNKDGEVIAEIENFVMYGRFGTTMSPDDLQYRVQWQETSLPDMGPNPYKDKLLIINGSDAFVKSMAVNESIETNTCQLLHDQCQHSTSVLSTLDQAVQSKWGRFENVSALVFVCDSYSTLTEPDEVSIMYQKVSRNIIGLSGLIKALMSRGFQPPLFIVTESVHGFAISGDFCRVSLAGSELWGYLRNLYVEFMYRDLTLVDISPSVQFAGSHFCHIVRTVLTSETSRSNDYAIVWDRIYNPRMVKTAITNIPPTLCVVPQSSNTFYSVKSSNATDLARLFATPVTNIEANKLRAETVKISVEQVCCSHASFYPKTTTEADGLHSPVLLAEAGHHMLALEYIGLEVQKFPEKSKNNRDRDRMVACYPTSINSVCEVPRKCAIKLSKIPDYQPGLLTAALIYCSVSDYISSNQSVVILSSSPRLLSTILCERIISKKAKYCLVLDENRTEALNSYFDVIVVLSDVTKQFLECFSRFSTLIFFKSAMPESMLNFLTFHANREIVLIDEKQVFVDSKLLTQVPKVAKFLLKNWATISRRKRGIFTDDPCYQTEITILPCETIQLSCNSICRLRAKLPLESVFRSNSLYIVVGGLTGLGWEILTLLAELGATAIATMNRRPCAASQQSEVKELENTTGCRIITLQADITSLPALNLCIQSLERSESKYNIRGVFQGAGVLDSAILSKMTEEQLHRVLKPKIVGTMNLHIATKHMELDFFMVQSSIAAIFGIPGQTSYGAANSFIDNFVDWRRQKGLPAMSVNWGALGVGMAADKRVAAELERRGHMLMSIQELRSCFMHALLNQQAHAVYAKLNNNQLVKDYSTEDMVRLRPMLGFLEDEFKEQDTRKQDRFDRKVYHSLDMDGKLTMVSQLLLGITQGLVGGDPTSVKISSKFVEIGIDSISSLTLSNIFYSDTSYRIPAELVSASDMTLFDIANHVLDNLQGEGDEATQLESVRL